MAIEPIDTFLSSEIKYPSSIFTLHKHELIPYERLAYNILKIGIEALHNASLPESLIIDYTKLPARTAPWSINASISAQMTENGKLAGFIINLPEFLPAIIHLFTHIVVKNLFAQNNFTAYQSDEKLLAQQISLFAEVVNIGIRKYKNESQSIGIAVRSSYDAIAFQWTQLQESINHFDLITQLIANHEIAHAYVGQLSNWEKGPSLDYRSYELIADLLATEWLYTHIIRNTPNTPEYCKFHGLETYSECILANTWLAIEAQQSLLILMAIAGAQNNTGIASLNGGSSHPNGLLRYLLQYVHLTTLVKSNYSDIVSNESFQTVNKQWEVVMDIFSKSGLILYKDIGSVLDKEAIQVIERAGEIIVDKNIKELIKIIEFLKQYSKNIVQAKENYNIY